MTTLVVALRMAYAASVGASKTVAAGEGKAAEVERRLRWRYHVQRWSFLTGVIALMISRAWLPLSAITARILP
jgi:hypothetical protein